MKKKLLIITLIFVFAFIMFGCFNINNETIAGDDTTINDSNLLDTHDVVYMGGLYARSETNDMMLALYKTDDKSVVVITEFGNIYYGNYVTEDAKLLDGTQYTKITVQDKTYGYYFYEDLTGILVDQDGNKYEAKKLDESVATDMLMSALSNQ